MDSNLSDLIDDFIFEDLDDYDNDEECVQLTSEPHTVLSVDPLAVFPVDTIFVKEPEKGEDEVPRIRVSCQKFVFIVKIFDEDIVKCF